MDSPPPARPAAIAADYANEFVGIQEVKSMLEFVEKSFPDLVKEVTRLIPLATVLTPNVAEVDPGPQQ